MDRTEAFIHIIDAMARLQGNIAFILEAKAIEAEKSRKWLCEFVRNGGFSDHRQQLNQSVEVHGQLIEVVDGIVKMENGMARNLKLLLNQKEQSDDASSSLLGDLFSNSGESSK